MPGGIHGRKGVDILFVFWYVFFVFHRGVSDVRPVTLHLVLVSPVSPFLHGAKCHGRWWLCDDGSKWWIGRRLLGVC